MKIHIVQKGDTLWKIAKKYGVNFEEVKKLNSQLSNPDMIMPGMKIKVPTAGANIKKEAPMGAPNSTINVGVNKEMPKKEQPIPKEQPLAPIAQVPVELPKEQLIPVKEQPLPVKEQPIKEKPTIPAPKMQPKKPYIPKMPQPILPEIDINNYFLMNMPNVNVHEQANKLPPNVPMSNIPANKPPNIPAPNVPPNILMPQLPQKPVNILPKVKEEVKQVKEEVKPVKEMELKKEVKPVKKVEPIKEKVKSVKEEPVQEIPIMDEESPVFKTPAHQPLGGQYPMMPNYYPGYNPCYQGYQPVPYPQVQGAYMPEQQLPYPQYQGGCHPAQQMPYPQVQGAYMPENQMPYPQVQGAYMPENQMPYPQVQGAYMPENQMPYPQVQGAYMPENQMPYPQVQGAYMPENQMPYPQVQGAYMPENQMPYPQVQGAYTPELENHHMYEESSPLMQQMPNEMENTFYNPVPQVQGASEEYHHHGLNENLPYMQGQMPSATLPAMQMPNPGYQHYPPMQHDCGCGGPKPFPHVGGYGVQPGYYPSHMMPGSYPIQQPAPMGYGFPAYGPMQGMGPYYGNPYRDGSPYGSGFEPEIQEDGYEEGSEYNG